MKPESLHELETPCVVIDYKRLVGNIKLMQDIAIKNKVTLRPHIKTHKCLEIAKMQIKEGAIGITASKTDEAIVFIQRGIKSITVAYPIIQEGKLERLVKSATENNVSLRIVADSIEEIRNISGVCKKFSFQIPVFIEIDVGLHRCGVTEDDPVLLDLVKFVEDDRNMSFAGLFSHAGHAYAAKNAEEIREIASEECDIMLRLRQKIQDNGHDILEISVGATPTALVSTAYSGISEIRPGNYVFLDMTPVRQGLIGQENIALSVLATVISKNNNYCIIDSGSKSLSSDLGAHGTAGTSSYGQVYKIEDYETMSNSLSVTKLSEEHGFVKHNGMDLKIGDKVRVFPNHSCPVANLSEWFYIVDKEKLINKWSVDARGCVL